MADTRRATVRVGPRGRVVIPSRLRRAAGIDEGDRLVITAEEDGSLRVVSSKDAARRVRGMLLDRVPPGRSLVDELIAARREEARREDG